MPLKLADSVIVDAPRDQVWDLFFDAEVMKEIANKVPGIRVERLNRVSEDRYEGTATIGVAMVKGRYDVVVNIVEKRMPEFIKIKGEGKGGGNFASGEMTLTLTEQGDKTLLKYEGIGNIGGALASVGQRLIDTVGKQFIANGTKALADELAARSKKLPS
jgi:carbon monoxide dehydrogenase subunit G